MSIMERLSREVPKRRASGKHNPQYQATLQFIEEIEQAKDLGYTWHQICTAVKDELMNAGIWRESWCFSDTEKIFHMVKKEGAAV